MKYPELQNFCAEGKRWIWKPEDDHLAHYGVKGRSGRKKKKWIDNKESNIKSKSKDIKEKSIPKQVEEQTEPEAKAEVQKKEPDIQAKSQKKNTEREKREASAKLAYKLFRKQAELRAKNK